MAVTNKKSDRKGSKMGRNGKILAKNALKWQGHGTGDIFHQCLWVTKYCAKFGRSRIPGAASAHNSFIVLRCMCKEPAPLQKFGICQDFEVKVWLKFHPIFLQVSFWLRQALP